MGAFYKFIMGALTGILGSAIVVADALYYYYFHDF